MFVTEYEISYLTLLCYQLLDEIRLPNLEKLKIFIV